MIVVVKQPVAGATKTRLTPVFTPAQAAELYRCLMLDTLALAHRVPDVEPVVAYTPAGAEAYFRRVVPDGFALLPQVGASLGERLNNALGHCLANGYGKAVIMNSDGPTLPAAFLQQAFARLDEADVVLGPDDDGGYYLVGLRQPQPALFEGIAWSTERVVVQTLGRIREQSLTVAVLPEWYDVDRPEDVRRIRDELRADPDLAPCTWTFLRDGNLQMGET